MQFGMPHSLPVPLAAMSACRMAISRMCAVQGKQGQVDLYLSTEQDWVSQSQRSWCVTHSSTLVFGVSLLVPDACRGTQAEKMGGSLSLESKFGEGSTFTVKVPLRAASSPQRFDTIMIQAQFAGSLPSPIL